MAYGDDIASKVPPPDKLKKGGGAPMMGEETPAEEADEDKAVRVSAMQELMDAMKGDDAEAACEKLDTYLGIIGR